MERNTKQRQLVLDAVRSRCDHPSADSIFADVRMKDGKVSRGTVYRNLKNLSSEGEVLRVRMPGCERFDLNVKPHCHVMCVHCGRVFDVPISYESDLDATVQETTGFKAVTHSTVFEGVCPECENRR